MHVNATVRSSVRPWLAALMASALLCQRVSAAPCFATDDDGTYDQDGAVNGIITITAASTSSVPAAATPYDCSSLDFAIQSGGQLELGSDPSTGSIAAIMVDDLTIAAGGLIQANGLGCPGGAAGSSQAGSAPDASNVCVQGATGSGSGGNDFGGSGGGGHGGRGSDGNAVGTGGGTYGSATAPVRFGAGGGGTGAASAPGGTGGGVVRLIVGGTLTHAGSILANGGDGGGTVFNRVTGGGAGGSIFITASVVDGAGSFAARGGDGKALTNSGGGGGGGRIAIVYGSGTFAPTSATFDVSIGANGAGGAKGTVYVERTGMGSVQIFHGFTFADVDHVVTSWVSDPSATNQYCDTTLAAGATPSVTANTITFGGALACTTAITRFDLTATGGAATLAFSPGAFFSANAAVTLDAGGSFDVGSGVTVANTKRGADLVFDIPPGDDQVWVNVAIFGAAEGRFVIDDPIDISLTGSATLVDANVEWTAVGNLTIDGGSTISATGKGCQAAFAGAGPGRAPDAFNVCTIGLAGAGGGGNDFGGSGGGGHGGAGGNGNNVGTGGGTYGSATAPALFGASAGDTGAATAPGGPGGGAIRLVVGGVLNHDGLISTNGGAGGGTVSNRVTGGGAGGSIFVTAASINGVGTFAARGGDGENRTNDGGGGGGGRIAIIHQAGSYVFGSDAFDVSGGLGPDGAADGAKGTVYVENTTTSAVRIFHGFTFADVDHVVSSWVSDPSATNQYCDATLGASATPSVTAPSIVFGGTLLCTPQIASFALTATGAPATLAMSPGASLTANAAVTLAAASSFDLGSGVTIANTKEDADLVFDIPAGDDQVWNGVTITGAPEGTFLIDAAIDITLAGASTVNANAAWMNLGNLTLAAGSTLAANARGCAGPATGSGVAPDASNACTVGITGGGVSGIDGSGAGGGGHGGEGGDGNGGRQGGGVYDDPANPLRFGATGGGTGGQTQPAGNGGGLLRLVIAGTLLHDGTIAANGGDGAGNVFNRATGGGAGGSINIVTGTYACTTGGTFLAAGGSGGNQSNADGGGGGGGRIRVSRNVDACAAAPLASLSAAVVAPGGLGPDGATDGAPGSLTIDGGASTTTSTSTTIPSTTTSSSTTTTSSTTSSTATTAPATTSTTTPPPTTTTLPSTGCEAVPDGPTFASILCRLAALLDRVNGETGLGDFGPKLAHTLGKGLARAEEAATRCAETDFKKARKRLQQVKKALTQYAHRLRGLPARRKLDPTLRADFLAAGVAIAADVTTLRGQLACPEDAPTS